MLDIQFIRDNPKEVQEKSRQKGIEVDIERLLELDNERRTRLTQIEELRRRRNEQAAELKKRRPTEDEIAAGRQLKEEINQLETDLNLINDKFDELLKAVPNMPTDDTPVGSTEDENVVTKTVGEPPKFDFEPRSDEQLGELRDLIDKGRAAKVAGSRFAYLKGDLVRLQFALINLVLDTLADEELLGKLIEENGLKIPAKMYTPVLPPPMIRTDVYEATARLNGAETTYKLEDDDLWLNASAEHSLAPYYMDEILAEADLPIRYVGYSTSFRREAGTYGKDMEGIFRLHHFDKLEMVAFSTPETSYDEHILMVAIQEHLVSRLELPYQVLLKCTADIGKPNARGVDINVWMPSQAKYRETHTADLITDYQARRTKTRLRRADGTVELVHNNDATAFAMSRILKAIVENYQNQDGSIRVPQALVSYLGGKELI